MHLMKLRKLLILHSRPQGKPRDLEMMDRFNIHYLEISLDITFAF